MQQHGLPRRPPHKAERIRAQPLQRDFPQVVRPFGLAHAADLGRQVGVLAVGAFAVAHPEVGPEVRRHEDPLTKDPLVAGRPRRDDRKDDRRCDGRLQDRRHRRPGRAEQRGDGKRGRHQERDRADIGRGAKGQSCNDQPHKPRPAADPVPCRQRGQRQRDEMQLARQHRGELDAKRPQRHRQRRQAALGLAEPPPPQVVDQPDRAQRRHHVDDHDADRGPDTEDQIGPGVDRRRPDSPVGAGLGRQPSVDAVLDNVGRKHVVGMGIRHRIDRDQDDPHETQGNRDQQDDRHGWKWQQGGSPFRQAWAGCCGFRRSGTPQGRWQPRTTAWRCE